MTLREWLGSDKTINGYHIRKMASKLGIEEFNQFIAEHEDATLEILKPTDITRTYFIDKVYNKLKPHLL